MNIKELIKAVDHETQWLRYYGHRKTRIADSYDDANFYDRIESIGYTKTIISLWERCMASCITSTKPVLESSIEELISTTGTRDHSKNMYTPLEYVLAKKIILGVYPGSFLHYKKILKETDKDKAKIGDTVRSFDGVEIIVKMEETDKDGMQYVWRESKEYFDDNPDQMYFSPESWALPWQNFEIVNKV